LAGGWSSGAASAGDDIYVGDGTNEAVNGLGGADLLTGGGGDDSLDGGAGLDTAAYAGATTGVTVSLVVTGPQNTGGAGVDTLVSIENLVGSVYDDVLTGTDGGELIRVSTNSAGAQAVDNGFRGSFDPVLSPNGAKLLFTSYANNLVAGDTNDLADVFLKDLTTGVVTRVSTNGAGGQAVGGSGGSTQASFSADGAKVIFTSTASNLVAGDTNGVADIFIKDLATGAVTRVSTTSAGGQSSVVQFPGDSGDGVLSADGTKVAFASYADNLVSGDTNLARDIFVKDLLTGAVTRVSTDSAGTQANLYAYASAPVFSPDGSKIAFLSDASNLVAGDTNGSRDVFVRNLATGVVTRVSTDGAGAQGNSEAMGVVFSPDGAKVMFTSYASNLVAGDTNDVSDLFIKDLVTGAVTRVSTDGVGSQANGYSRNAVFSPDGASVAFESYASNLTPGDSNFAVDLFVKTLSTGAVKRVGPSDSLAGGAVFSADGTKVAFASTSGALAPGDTNYATDIFIGDLTSTGANVLNGGDGQDVLNGRGGNDFLVGGKGNDVLQGDDADLATLDGDDTLTGGDGDDVLIGGGGNDTLSGGDGNDILAGGVGAGGLSGGRASLTSYLANEGGIDMIDGGTGVDLAFIAFAARVAPIVFDNSNANAVNTIMVGGVAAGSVTGVEQIVFIGGVGGDTITGGGSNDTLVGNQGNDVLAGGLGDDVLDGGGDVDTASYAWAAAGVTVNLAQAGPQDTGAGVDTLLSIESLMGSAFSDQFIGDEANNGLLGEGGQDWLISAGGADQLWGGEGQDSVWGGAGDDLLDGGAGDDTIDGGAGVDTVSYDRAGGGVEVDLSILEDQLTRGAGIDTLVSIENIVGSAFDDRLAGNAGGNRLTGGAGADLLAGGGGADHFVYLALSETAAGARDVIADFTRGSDRIDVSAIDAASATAGDQAFHLGATGGHVGDIIVAYDASSGQTSVSLHVDGDATADAVIMLVGDLNALAASDFVL